LPHRVDGLASLDPIASESLELNFGNVSRLRIMGETKGLGTREKIAAVVSAAIVLTFVVYWIVQIDGVMDMLKLANG
jgi:hypothetical protein